MKKILRSLCILLFTVMSMAGKTQDLLPSANNSYDIGSSSLGWKSLYLTNSMYLNGTLSLHAPGTGNFFAGRGTGNTTLTGAYNSAFGSNCFYSVTSGNYNVTNGYYALRANTIGSGNTAMGTYAMYNNTAGNNNTAQGYYALRSNTTGYGNVAVGVRALYKNTTAKNLVAVGDSALYNSTGSFNTALGSKALYTNTTGTINTATGYQALYSNVNGNEISSAYDKKGNWLYTIERHGAASLLKNVMDIVKDSYYDYFISGMEKVDRPGHNTIYIVHLEDINSIKTVRVSNGEVELVKDFKRA